MQVSRSDSEWLTAYFAEVTRDLTPATLQPALVVLHAAVSEDPEVTVRCSSVLSDDELHRAECFAGQDESTLFKQRRAFRRYCGSLALGSTGSLSQITFCSMENEQPRLLGLPEFCFSFSSCRLGFLAAWSSTHTIGVDFEDPTRDLEAVDMARRFYSQAEARAVENAAGLARQRQFFRFWCLKEAALKSIGEGLPSGLDAFEFELDPVLRIVRAPPEHGTPGKFKASLVEGTDGCAAAVIRILD